MVSAKFRQSHCLYPCGPHRVRHLRVPPVDIHLLDSSLGLAGHHRGDRRAAAAAGHGVQVDRMRMHLPGYQGRGARATVRYDGLYRPRLYGAQSCDVGPQGRGEVNGCRLPDNSLAPARWIERGGGPELLETAGSRGAITPARDHAKSALRRQERGQRRDVGGRQVELRHVSVGPLGGGIAEPANRSSREDLTPMCDSSGPIGVPNAPMRWQP